MSLWQKNWCGGVNLNHKSFPRNVPHEYMIWGFYLSSWGRALEWTGPSLLSIGFFVSRMDLKKPRRPENPWNSFHFTQFSGKLHSGVHLGVGVSDWTPPWCDLCMVTETTGPFHASLVQTSRNAFCDHLACTNWSVYDFCRQVGNFISYDPCFWKHCNWIYRYLSIDGKRKDKILYFLRKANFPPHDHCGQLAKIIFSDLLRKNNNSNLVYDYWAQYEWSYSMNYLWFSMFSLQHHVWVEYKKQSRTWRQL